MIIKNGLIHSLEKGFYPDTIYIEETRFANLTSDEKILDASRCLDRNASSSSVTACEQPVYLTVIMN